LSEVAGAETSRVQVRRISEEMQKDATLMKVLRRVGAQPGESVAAVAKPEGVLLGSGGETAEILDEAAQHIFVRKVS
jgi:DtxR family transcriptional regulator, Mn-dependent transcriptional regulator